MSKLIKRIVPVLILAAGLVAGFWFFANPKEVQKRPPQEAQALLVETGKAEFGNFAATVEAMGQVVPAQQAALKPQVAGEIVIATAEFVPGGAFAEGDEILRIDPADYEIAVKKAEAALRQAQADYELEMGRQSIAKDEMAIIERTTGHKPEKTELALRGPQLAQAQAGVERAKADLETAKLSLARTTLTAPFNALVTNRLAAQGDKVSAGQALATLAGTDEYWIEIAVPVDDLKWIDLPRAGDGAGSFAKVILDGGRGERAGMLMKLTGTLDSQSRLATLLVSVPDPLLRGGGEGPPLILSDYAKVMIEGKKLEGAARIPLPWLREGGIVWVIEEGKLALRKLDVIYRDRTHAFIGARLTATDEIIVSEIAVPVEGMKIRAAGDGSR